MTSREQQDEKLQQELWVEQMCQENETKIGLNLHPTLNVFWAFKFREYDNTTAALLTVAHILNNKTA